MRRWLVEREGPRVVCYIYLVFSYALCVSLSVSLLVVCVFLVVCLERLSISPSYRFDRFYICVVVVVVPLYLFSRGRSRTMYFVVFLSWLTYFFRTVLSVEILIDPRFGGSCVRYKMVWDVNCRIYIWFPCVTKLRELHCWAWVLAFWRGSSCQSVRIVVRQTIATASRWFDCGSGCCVAASLYSILFNFVRFVPLFRFVSIRRPSVSIFVPLVALSSACHVFITHSSHQCRYSQYSQLRGRAALDLDVCYIVNLYTDRLFYCRLVNYPHWLSSTSSMSTQKRLLVISVYCWWIVRW